MHTVCFLLAEKTVKKLASQYLLNDSIPELEDET
jgi:hypothetical protein